MKRRNFLSNSAILSVSVPLGIATPAFISSCSTEGKKESGKKYTPEELGTFSFVDIAPDGDPLKAALIGCGDRGTGAAIQFLESGPNISIVALADLFSDRMDTCRKILADRFSNNVEDSRCLLGFDAYKKIMEMQDVDIVLLCTPTHFRPEHFKAAVEAGKHIFMEKPCAVDPVGIRTVIAASKVATSKGLTVITGNQRRHRRDYWDAYVQVRNGIIGDIISATSHWNQGAWWNKKHRPEWSDMEYCIRNWFNIKWLSGDHILDQGIHNIDVVTWFMGEMPLRAVGFGGRARRLTGDIYDFFSVDYYYNNNKRMLHTARQIDGCDGNVSEQVMGTKGIAQLNDRGEIKILDWNGNLLWEYDYENKPVNNPYNQEHIHLVESIRMGKKINQAEDLAYSNMVAIMGREAAYTGKAISWDEIMASPLRYGPEHYEMGPLPDYQEGVVPVPGKDPSAPM
ncbi:Gfo/Idh/MocA family protein [Seramator thermalis]|jgi:predicted dehydrogenase|uniref:Gfo/Idh/MocA family protein n=1 Tax=Seramator thermalis TaxID=2496270 RepID=UPI00101B736E|nr:Gfo/Idh/MocA family oxidoreductase [Seramator thermalis]